MAAGAQVSEENAEARPLGPATANGYSNFQAAGGRGNFGVFSGSCVSAHSKCVVLRRVRVAPCDR